MPHPELVIATPINDDELLQVADLERRASLLTYVDPPAGITEEVVHGWGWGDDRVEKYRQRFFDPEEAAMWVGYMGGVIVGYAAASYDEHHPEYPGPFVRKIYVDPDWQNQKIGNALLECTEAWLENRGSNTFQLLVTTGNHRARGFYERRGYRQQGEPIVKIPGLPELLYVKHV